MCKNFFIDKLRVNKKNWLQFFLSLIVLLAANHAFAVTYTFSDTGVSPALSGCSRTGAGTYVCTNAVTLTGNDSIVIAGTVPATITFNSNLTLQFLNESTSAKINSAGLASNLNLIINGNLTTGKKVIVQAQIRAGSVNDPGGDVVFGGSINTTTGNINIGYSSDVTGSITSTSGQITLGDQITVSGAVTSTSGGINFTNQSTIGGDVSCSSCVFTLSGLPSRINGNVNVAKLLDYVDIYNRGTQYGGSITVTSTSLVDAYLKLGNFSNVAGNVSAISNFANNPFVIIGNSAIVQGSVSATANASAADAYVYIYDLARVVGNVSANATTAFEFARVETRPGANIGGSISAIAATPSYGTVYLYSGTVSGSVVSSDSVYNFANVAGCVQSTNPSGADITLYSGSTSGGVCCGSSNNGCTNSCVFNLAGAMPPTCSLDATLIAYYALDESSWNGTLNETKDTAGFIGGPFDGQAIGTPRPTATNNSPARAGANGTCGYAGFAGSSGASAFILDGLPVSTANGAKTSVSFWMYWDGASVVKIPISWNKYDLVINTDGFGFSTLELDRFGISSTAGLALNWRHIVAIFTNGNVAGNELYIDGVKRTLTQIRGTPNNTSAVVQSPLKVGGSNFVNTVGFDRGRIDEVKVYRGALTQTQVTADFNATHACLFFNVVPSRFNCVATGANASDGRLFTQVAGSAFNVDVVALKADNSIETAFVTSGTKNVNVEFVNGAGTTACGSRATLSPAVSQTVTFAPADAGRKAVTATITSAHRDVVCRVTDANQAPSVVGCSTDDFAVRPASFTVTSTANADAAGTSITASPIVKAGAPFTLTANTGVAGYDGTPLIDATKLNAHVGAAQLGTLNGNFSAANIATGLASGNAFNYSEVGYFRLTANGVFDSTFTAVDAASGDCATGFVSAGGRQACSFGNTVATNFFGRFIPDRFAMTTGANTEGCDSGNFTYFGQDGLSTGFSLVAQNTSNATTLNYTGGFAKLGVNIWSNFSFDALGLPAGAILSASATAPTGSWLNGTASISAKHLISRPSSAVAPANITIRAAPTDADGVTMSRAAVGSASLFRYGRLWLPNSYGSELLPLNIPIEAQYWNGNAYVRNQQDNCSAVPANSLAMSNFRNNLAACETQLSGGGVLLNGNVSANLSRPGAGNSGSVDLTLNLNGASGNTCNSATQSSAGNANMPWFGNNPNARATFGIFKTPMIYMRENF